MTTYNGENASTPVTVLLGVNGDKNSALKNAGYVKYADTNYTYGTDASRKLWCAKDTNDSLCVQTVLAVLTANYSVSA